jgi:hypothetical protein
MGLKGSKLPETGYSVVLLTPPIELLRTTSKICLFKNNAASGEVIIVHRGVNL